ncbi:CinA family protein [Microbacterium sp. CFH 31415]|uniref:CinA family protein n=1 Tax=Microbacterium sp. CFH 31415 TaxID=2921732 RepID=UPI001F13EF54|nr:CinA family protein [Microbacterium sp. CFH 31415]MCH6231246.1 CinA family protein [Microbacterium sp. CFH 31415]
MVDRAERIAQAAKDRDLQVGVAESLTCGLLSSTIGAGSDAEAWFAGGVVAYRTEVKESVLGMTPGIDTCSSQCAVEIAQGVKRVLGVDIAVSTTGVGGPDPQDGHPAGTVYLGWATADDSGHRFHAFSGSPEEVLEQTVDAALALLEELVEE